MQPKWLIYGLALALTTALAPIGLAEDPAAPLLVEVQPNPDGPDRGNEWVELANPTPVPLALDGLYLTDDSDCFRDGDTEKGDRWALDGTLAPMSVTKVTLLYDCIRLSNAGDELRLETEDGDVLQTVAYGTEGDLAAPTAGESLAACHVGAHVHANWTLAPSTPGQANPSCVA